MSRPIGVTVWAQIKPKLERRWNSSTQSFENRVASANLVRTTVNRPTKPEAGVLLMKLRIIVPESAFLPFVPEAIITIPEDMLTEQVLTVVAEDPREEQA